MANNSTRDILQRMSDHLEDLEGLDYEKTQPLPDDVTDLNTFMTPGIYRVEHPENVAHGPFSDSTSSYHYYTYILIVKSKLDAAPSWCQQYAIIAGANYFRSNANGSAVINSLNDQKWVKIIDEIVASSYMKYGAGVGAISGNKTYVDLGTPNQSFVPLFVTVYTLDGEHFAFFAVVSNPFASGTEKWICKAIVSDQEISLAPIDATHLRLSRSGSLLNYEYVTYTTISSVMR